MADWTSLFARKLRAHRARSGTHGRMTQEDLAAMLDVSVDAVSKYERSLSFIRGDLEHRLVERLGWRQDEVVACREDWEAGRATPSLPSYRVLREREIVHEFGGSVAAVMTAIAGMESGEPANLPAGFSAGDPAWVAIAEAGALIGAFVMHGADLVSNVALIFPGPEKEKRFRDRLLEEGELSPDYLKRPILPGRYFSYCPAVYIARGHEAAARPLLSGFVGLLEELAEREILIRDIGAISVSPVGRQLCSELGLRWLGQHQQHDDFGMWVLPGRAIADSLVGRRSAKLRRAYGEAFPDR